MHRRGARAAVRRRLPDPTECSPIATLAGLGEACGNGEQVALVIADIWTSEISGLEWLERAREACPKAARCVLVGWGDGEGFTQVRRALVTGQLETFLIRPCTDPEERLYPVVGEILGRWARANRPPALAWEPPRVAPKP